MPRVAGVECLHDFVIRVKFTDGFAREIDLEPELHGRIFGPLRDPAVFRQVKADVEGNTIAWPNGADISPEFLRWGDDPPPPFHPEPRQARR